MDSLILTDITRFSHILTVIIGLGGAFLADFYVLARLKDPIEGSFIDMLKLYHLIVAVAIFAMWVTGLVMIYIRTGFALENFSPKLFSKLGIVAVLTVNAVMIGKIAMPILVKNVGTQLLDLPFKQRIGLTLMSAVSTISWLLALTMGVSKVLANSPWETFKTIVLFAYAVAIIVALALLLLIDLFRSTLRYIRAKTAFENRVCGCPACRREGDILEQLFALRSDLIALQLSRTSPDAAQSFVPPLRTVAG